VATKQVAPTLLIVALQGGTRFETVGDIVYSGAMLAVSVVLVAFSAQDLGRHEVDKDLHIPALVAVCIAFVTKFVLFVYCYSIRGKNSQVRVLWEE
jgi:divalent metal cation (Fe/Co/Zn/Cd) transporter